jgi:flavin reductase (DIM6/NTAB) family NADH-FMN oxidoreductase RutF
MKSYRKKDFPLEQIRRFLEPGPIVMVSSAYRAERNIMTMGWHMMLGFEPALFGCFIWDQNHSHELIRRSRECVINVPEAHLLDVAIDIGNTHSTGRGPDKFERFGLTAVAGDRVKAPLIAECYANFECRLIDVSLVRKYSLFMFECVKAHVATRPKYPTTFHYRGDGVFMISGRNVSHRKRFKPEML